MVLRYVCGMAKRLGWYRAEQLVLRITLAGSAPKIWRRPGHYSDLPRRRERRWTTWAESTAISMWLWLGALQDSANHMHQDAVALLGNDFDPLQFDSNTATLRVAKLFKPLPKKPGKPAKKPT